MGIGSIIGQFLKALGAALGLAKQRDGELNTPEQQSRASAATVQRDRDNADKAIAAPDLKELEKEVAE
jgi:hypothetical protein